MGEWSTPRFGRFTPGKETPVPILQEAGWAPGPIWKGGENVASIGILYPESPARIELLRVYTLHYPVPHRWKIYFAVLHTCKDKATLLYARHYGDWTKYFQPDFRIPGATEYFLFCSAFQQSAETIRPPIRLVLGSVPCGTKVIMLDDLALFLATRVTPVLTFRTESGPTGSIIQRILG